VVAADVLRDLAAISGHYCHELTADPHFLWCERNGHPKTEESFETTLGNRVSAKCVSHFRDNAF